MALTLVAAAWLVALGASEAAGGTPTRVLVTLDPEALARADAELAAAAPAAGRQAAPRRAGAPPSAAALARVQSAALATAAGPGWRTTFRAAAMPILIGEADAAALKRLAAAPGVLAIEPDRRVRGAMLQSAPTLGAPRAAELGYTGQGVTIGIIDTGIDLTHPDLADALVAGLRVDGGTSSTAAGAVQDDNGHGTHLAGIITGNGQPVRGIAPDVGLVVIKALDATNGGLVSDVIIGIDWLVANRAQFPTLRWLNLSLVIEVLVQRCPCPSSVSPVLTAAIARLQAAGITCVAAAGNDGPGQMSAPACFAGVVSVGAVYDAAFARAPAAGDYGDDGYFFSCHDELPTTGSLTCFSSRNGCLDLLAPGYEIVSDALGGGTAAAYGTSQAAAHATAALALMQQAAPTLSNQQLLDLLIDTGQPVSDPSDVATSYRAIDLATALQMLSNGARRWGLYQ